MNKYVVFSTFRFLLRIACMQHFWMKKKKKSRPTKDWHNWIISNANGRMTNDYIVWISFKNDIFQWYVKLHARTILRRTTPQIGVARRQEFIARFDGIPTWKQLKYRKSRKFIRKKFTLRNSSVSEENYRMPLNVVYDFALEIFFLIKP